MKTSMTVYFACGAAFVLAGCQTAEPTAPIGDSVRLMVEAQTFNPNATSTNGTKLPEGTDPDRSAAALEAMRGGVAKPTETWTTTIITGAATSSGN